MEFDDDGPNSLVTIEFALSKGEPIQLVFAPSQIGQLAAAMLDVQARLSADRPQ